MGRFIEIKTRGQMPAKMFPHLKLCRLFMGPTLGVDTKQRNSFLIKFGVIKSKIVILFIVKYEKITLLMSFLLLGPIIRRFFACSNEWKK